MIKQINHQNISITPFIAVKAWEFFNTDSDAGIAIESSTISVDDADTIALEFIDYNIGTNPSLNRQCNIVLEQQADDKLIFEEGVSSSYKSFDTASQPRNYNGSYKSLVYTQISKAFYNNYHNPTQIWGMENIDFPLSRTTRYITNNFRMFTIPRKMFGEKIVEGSVAFYDNSLDDNVDIHDDKFGNLVATNNLFSKVQEVRTLGNTISNDPYTAYYVYSNGILSMKADNGNVYDVYAYNDAGNIMLEVSQSVSSTSVTNTNLLRFRANDGNYYIFTLTEAEGIITVEISQTPSGILTGYESLSLLANDLNYYDLSLYNDAGLITYTINQTPS